MEAPFQFRSYSNYMRLIKAVLRHVANFVARGPFFCVTTASTKLFSEVFAVWHSPYLVSKFELGRPSEHGEMGWEHFCDEQEHEYEKRQ